MIRLRAAILTDLDLLISTEQTKTNSRYICPNTKAEHELNLQNEDLAYFMVESIEDKFIGYVILAGKTNLSSSIELRRIVIAEKGKGYGRKALILIKKYAFEELAANRLWLDVFEFNKVGLRLYPSVGFVKEGVLRQSYLGEEGYRNQIVMSVLKEEYQG
ncbi:MAG: diamine N-acetyltransferase [Polaribacter sp.]|jgi:diamine N-acetyltransferase